MVGRPNERETYSQRDSSYHARNRTRRVQKLSKVQVRRIKVVATVILWTFAFFAGALFKQMTIEPIVETKYIPVTARVTSQPTSSPSPSVEVTDSATEGPFTLVGEFTVTAYCGDVICTGNYGKNRPVVNGTTIVFTANGDIAQEGVTVAADPKVIPYGTKIYIEGVGVRVVQDCGGAIKGNRLDVYYVDHNDAWTSGLNDRPRNVWIIDEEVNP